MICSFYKKQEAVEVIPLCLEQNEVTDDYTLKVVGLATTPTQDSSR